MTVAQTAEYLGLPESTLRYWLVQRIAPKSKAIGRRRMFTREDVDAWVEAGGPDAEKERQKAVAVA